jgi:hypothetical protein
MADPNADASRLAEYQFKPGQSGNPGGLSKELRAQIAANAEKATRIRAALLAKVEALIDPETGAFADDISGELLKLIKDSEDRGLGAPTNKTALTDADGNSVGGKITVEIIP